MNTVRPDPSVGMASPPPSRSGATTAGADTIARAIADTVTPPVVRTTAKKRKVSCTLGTLCFHERACCVHDVVTHVEHLSDSSLVTTTRPSGWRTLSPCSRTFFVRDSEQHLVHRQLLQLPASPTALILRSIVSMTSSKCGHGRPR